MGGNFLRKKSLACFLIACLIFSMIPNGITLMTVNAAEFEDLEIRFEGGGRIGNESHSAENTITSFYNNEAGFSYKKQGSVTLDPIDGDVLLYEGDRATLTLTVKDNPLLRELVKSGHAEVEY